MESMTYASLRETVQSTGNVPKNKDLRARLKACAEEIAALSRVSKRRMRAPRARKRSRMALEVTREIGRRGDEQAGLDADGDEGRAGGEVVAGERALGGDDAARLAGGVDARHAGVDRGTDVRMVGL